MKIKHIRFFVALFALVFSLGVTSFPHRVQAVANTPCFQYNSAWYTTHPTSQVRLSSTQVITIPNSATTPSILQELPFKGRSDCLSSGSFSYIPSHILLATENLVFGAYTNQGFDTFIDDELNWIYDRASLTTFSTINSYFDPHNDFSSWSEQTNLLKDNEDKIIDFIDKNHKLVIGATGNGTRPTQTAEIPMTNCVKLSGNGSKKIVFMRNNSSSLSVTDFVSKANDLMTNAFAKTDPWKTYLDKLSFYIDLKTQNVASNTPAGDVNNVSSCGNVTPLMYLIIGDNATSPAAGLDGHVAQIPKYSLEPDYLELAVHEAGHAVGHLWDASSCQVHYGKAQFEKKITLESNCTKKNSNFTYNNLWYGGNVKQDDFDNNTNTPVQWFIPTQKSLMMYPPDNIKSYDVISCGFLVAAIVDQPVGDSGWTNVDWAHARKHWPAIDEADPSRPGCGPKYDTLGRPIQGPMNTTIASIPPKSPASQATGVNAMPNQLNTYSVSGSNFTPTNNAVKLTYVSLLASDSSAKNIASKKDSAWSRFWKPLFSFFSGVDNTASVITAVATIPATYDIPGLSSVDGKTLTFTVPADVPSGKYKVSVGAFNSPWTDTSFTIDVIGTGGTLPPTSPTPTPVSDIPTWVTYANITNILSYTPTLQANPISLYSIRLRFGNGLDFRWKDLIDPTITRRYQPTYRVVEDAIVDGKVVTTNPVTLMNVPGDSTTGYAYYLAGGLTIGSKHCYRVIAFIGDRQSKWSNSVCPSTLLPAKPTLIVKPTEATAITLSFGSATPGVTYTILPGKTVYLAGQIIPDTAILAKNISTTTYNVTGLTPNTNYCYSVYTTIEGVRSLQSIVTCATTLALKATISLTSPLPANPATGNLTFALASANTSLITSADLYYVKGTVEIPDVKIATGTSVPVWNFAVNSKTLLNGTYGFYAIVKFGSVSITTPVVSVWVKN